MCVLFTVLTGVPHGDSTDKAIVIEVLANVHLHHNSVDMNDSGRGDSSEAKSILGKNEE